MLSSQELLIAILMRSHSCHTERLENGVNPEGVATKGERDQAHALFDLPGLLGRSVNSLMA